MGSELPFSVGSGAVARVRLGSGVGVGVGVPVSAKISANCHMASMVWAPKLDKGAAGTGLARALERRLALSMAALEEEIVGMAPLWGKNLPFWLCILPVYPEHRCGSIVSGVGLYQCKILP